MSNDPDLTAVVMRSSDWSDLLTRTEYLEHIRDYDDRVVTQVRGLRDRITALVEQLQATHDRIEAARDEVAAKERELDARRSEISLTAGGARGGEERPRGRPPGAPREGTPDRRRPQRHPGASRPGSSRAGRRRDRAVERPLAVRAVIEAANEINEMPYVWGGGHGSFEASGYDCSGAVSFALHGGGFLDSPLDSSGLSVWPSPVAAAGSPSMAPVATRTP